jgi:hypothetical protein
MAMFFFDMKDGVPMRVRIGVEFNTNSEAIEHSKELAKHFRDEACATTKNLRYPWLARRVGKFTASSFTGNRQK